MIDHDKSYNQILRLIQPVLDSVGEMQGLWLKFVDTSGEYILTSQSVCACEFCGYIRSTSGGLSHCRQSARQAVEKSLQVCGPVRTRCLAGLSTVTVPVMIGERCLGALLAGQIVEEDFRETIRLNIPGIAARFNLDPDTLLKYFDQIPLLTEEKISIITRSLNAFSNCFIEIGAAEARKEKTELEKSLKEMELKALQNQINPHFLFNTLNTIEMLAMMEGARQTPKIVHSLAQMLRHSLYSGSDLVSVSQEINSVNSYLTIQKCRFGSRLRVYNRIPPQLMDYCIPVLTLQPLVENAIIHGLEPQEKRGCLRLEGLIEGEDVILRVVDNGIGMTADNLALLKGQLDGTDAGSSNIGLINVQKRCQLYFGPGYGISVSSTPGKGTTVIMRVPARVYKVGVSVEAVNS